MCDCRVVRHVCFISNKYTRFSFYPSKLLPVKLQQMNSRGGQRQRKHHRQEAIKVSLHIKTTSIDSKVLFKNQKYRIIQFRPSIHQPTHYPPLITPHPEERIWAGRTPRVPDDPRIKHDKMKQFYMVDMGQKM